MEISWYVTFDHRFDNNLWMAWILCCRLNVLESRHSGLEFGHKFRIFLIKNQEIYCRFNVVLQVTRNSDSNYVPIEGRTNGNLMFCSRNWIWNIFPISWDQSSQYQIFFKKNTLMACYSRTIIALEILLKCDLQSPFRQ